MPSLEPIFVVTTPLVPKEVSRVPLVAYLTIAKLSAENHAATILPSLCIAIERISLLEPKFVVTTPLVPKEVSKVPFELYLTTAKSALEVLSIHEYPATTILPSLWITTEYD
jgi:hypothetical protein